MGIEEVLEFELMKIINADDVMRDYEDGIITGQTAMNIIFELVEHQDPNEITSIIRAEWVHEMNEICKRSRTKNDRDKLFDFVAGTGATQFVDEEFRKEQRRKKNICLQLWCNYFKINLEGEL